MAILETVYVVSVNLVNEHHVNKTIQKRKVYSHTRNNVIVEHYGDKVRIPIEWCFSDLESAQRECESRANELISKLVMRIEELKQPVEVSDKMYGTFDSE